MKTSATTLGWLVMAAVRKAMGGAMLAAALVLGTTACSSDDTIAEEPTPQQPANPAVTADGKVHVTVGAGIGDDGQTRSAVVETEYYDEDENEKTRRTLTFTLPVGNEGDTDYSPGDRLYIVGDITRNVRRMGGLLTITNVSDDGTSATFEGDLTVWVKDGGTWKEDTEWAAAQEGDPMTWYGENGIHSWLIPAATAAHADIFIYGSDGGFSFNHDYSLVTGDGDLVNKLMESAIEVEGNYNKTDKYFKLQCGKPIFNCTISGLAANTRYYVRFGCAESEEQYNSTGPYDGNTYAPAVTTDGDGTARFAFSTGVSGGGYYGLQLCTDNGFSQDNPNVLDCILGMREGMSQFDAKVYNLSRYWNGTTFQKLVDLSKFENYYTANDGDVLTGVMPEGYGVIIPDGATVTLFNASINSDGSGIDCLFSYEEDNATIILEGTNTVKGGVGEQGIYVREGLLTIKGSGSLRAEGGTDDEGEYKFGGAGIGSESSYANVIIESGTVTAIGGYGAPGIGSRYDPSGCGFGTITIKNTVTSVTATKGPDAPYCIGPSKDGTCGKITFDNRNVYDGEAWDGEMNFIIDNGGDYYFGGLMVTVDNANGTWTLTPTP